MARICLDSLFQTIACFSRHLSPIRKPPFEAQTEIVHRVDRLFSHSDRIEQQANNALARVNNLTQSILAKAFRGELTEQWRKDNPELIIGESIAAMWPTQQAGT